MRRLLPLLILSSAVLWSATASAASPTAKEIVDKVMDSNALGFGSGQATIKLVVEDSKGTTRERSFEARSKKIDERAHTRITLTAPREVRGQAFLFVERPGEDDVWMYVPAFKVTRRIEGGQKDGAFLGSHLTYADLESRDLKDAAYERLEDEKIGKFDVYVVDAKPTSGTATKRIRLFVRTTDFTLLRMQFFEDAEKPSRVLFVEKLDKTSSGKTYASQMTIRPADGGRTTLVVESLDEAELDDGLFSKSSLGQ